MTDEGFGPRSHNCLEMSRLQVLFYIWDSQVALVIKNLPASAGDIQDTGSFPGLRSPGEGNGKPTAVFLPEEPHGQRSLEGYST